MSVSRVTLAPEGRSPGLARRHVRAALDDAGLGHLCDDALLLVTELVTNAVVHAGTEIELRVEVAGGVLRTEVLDQSPGSLPVLRGDADGMREGGRGLFLLDALTVEWGTTHTRRGKSVWFLLGTETEEPTPPAAPPLQLPDAVPGVADVAWLLALHDDLEVRLAPRQVLGELVHRLCDTLGVTDAVLVVEDEGTSERWSVAAVCGTPPDDDAVAHVRRQARAVEAPVATGAGTTLLPIRGRGGAFGALVLGVDGLDPARTAVARLVTDRLAMVLRDHRSEAAQSRQRGSLSLLAEASDMFAATLDVQLAVTLAAQLVVPRFARWSAVYTTIERGVRLSAVAHEEEDCVAALRVGLSATAGSEFAERLVSELQGQRPALLDTTELAAVVGDEVGGDVLALPLVARRRLLGGLLVARPAGSTYAAEDVTLLLDLARRAALAVDNARLYEERTAIAHALQASLLPPQLPVSPEVDFGARYVPAGEGNEVGGDFYDVFALPEGGWAVAIGDVCGKGAEAAAITGLARNVLRLLLREGRSPAEAFRRLNDAILELGDRGRFCTSALATVRRQGDELVLCMASAGHPPAVVVRGDGVPSFVGRSGTLLGVVDDLDIEDESVRLGPGDAFVLYTDGVTERRRGEEMFGEQTLLRVLERGAGRSADALAGLLEREVQAFGPGASRDDLAVLVVRAPGEPAPVGQPATDAVLQG